MVRRSLWFEGPERVSVRVETLSPPGPGEVLVQSIASAISAGTEMLFYRGAVEEGVVVDTTLEGYGTNIYPLRYGYASVGRVTGVGVGAPASLEGRIVFAFTPHASAFCLPAERIFPVPEGIGPEDAVLLASAETATTLVLDARPLVGERVSVFGLGVIGLLTAGLLNRFPLSRITGWDLHSMRREAAAALGVQSADPRETPPARGTEDVTLELTGTADGFRMALSACSFSGRLVVGSWYGRKARAQPLDAFDTAFHRSRVRIVSSQVSTIDPAISGRWTKERRLATAWEAIRLLRPARWITHRVPFSHAEEAYRLIACAPERTIQVILAHGSEETRPPVP